MTRFFGRFTEMQAETLAALVADLPDEKVLASPEPAPTKEKSPSKEMAIEKMTRNELVAELEALGVPVPTNEYQKVDNLRGILLKALKRKAETE
jgi:transcriptional regulator of nitric oxide reductase